jgi:hypothetical protein
MSDIAPSQPTVPLDPAFRLPQKRKMNPWLKGCLIASLIFVGLCLLAVGLCFYALTVK